MALSLEQTVRLVGTELWRKRLPLAMAGVMAGLIMLVVGYLWPKAYHAEAMIFVSRTDVINPIMEGTTYNVGPRDHVMIAQEIMTGRRVMDRVLSEIGMLTETMSGPERDFVRDVVRDRVKVNRMGDYLLKIAYNDGDARRAYELVKRLSEYFVEEARTAMKRESQEAYEFVDSQVKHYHAKLLESEDRLRQFRNDNLGSLPEAAKDVMGRITDLREQIDARQIEIRELQTRKTALDQQLSGELVVSAAQMRDREILERMRSLQTELDTLRLSYTEEYPDIVSLKRQLGDLEAQLSVNGGTALVFAQDSEDSSALSSPLYQELRSKLAETETQIEIGRSRVDNLRELLSNEIDRAKRVSASDTVLQELTRDYEVTEKNYQNLLQRRENARISLTLELEQQGVTLRIQEPAELPTRPFGIRFLHFALAGAAAILAVPIALAFAFAKFDPRVREPLQLTHDFQLPVLAVVPRQLNDDDRLASRLRTAACILLGCVVVVAYGVAGWMKHSGSI